MTSYEQNLRLAAAAAARHSLDRVLVCAVIDRESKWETWAIRYEREFFRNYVAAQFTNNKIDLTEAQARAFSWGLMQVMGQTAREFGFTGDLPALCEPMNGLEIGCKVLAHKLAVAKGDVEEGLSLWNGGANKAYAAEVMSLMDKYKLPPEAAENGAQG